ncbi:aspartate aminotransferase family protein [Ancylobacter amanitiformis]|uniref:Glutamate-1-semialdehyde 2,1-aminomutase n=1 Tax=Ancylobacter amanitiformis TaxID=217069 RepID=A0ABU0LVX9_9HYPH|nr:aspartate aminotransferase family protein [Ancylobacter amanitiformis]MDQ0512891.1 glutamate-1-semialdehyde 2,1-aminomutase [Ancylobacter amanitiformis]
MSRHDTAQSLRAFQRGQRVFPDGTARVTIEKDPCPVYIERGEGAWVEDLDGRRFLDLHGNFTSLINGHAFPPVVEAVTRQLRKGSCFANPTESELALAELLCARIAGMDRLRFVNTGTEAVMFAVKAARAITGRSGIAKIEGAYHGAYDWIEVSQTSGPANWGSDAQPASVPYYRGMPDSVVNEVVTLRINDAPAAKRLIERHAAHLAAIVIDPMPSRLGLIGATPDFLTVMQAAARRNGILIIADEVLNFRQGYSGLSAQLGLKPDLWALGKIIGGGFPIGAIGGRADVMEVFARRGGPALVPQGGTFSANPISMTAGHANMQALTPSAFARLEAMGDRLRDALRIAIAASGLPFSITGAASLLRVHAKGAAPTDYRQSVETPAQRGAIQRLVAHFAAGGLLMQTSGMMCLSTPMQDADIELISGTFETYLHEELRHGGACARAAVGE